MSKPKARKPKRVIARAKGEGGDIQIKRLKRRERKFKLPFGPFHGSYASLFTIASGVLAYHLYVKPIPAFSKLSFPWNMLPTTLTLGVLAGFAYVAWVYGFKVKKYYKGFTQYVFLLFLLSLLSGILTPFVTEFSAVRQSNNSPPQYGELDTSLLTSPYLSDLFDGLDLPLDMLNPNYEFISVYAPSGQPSLDQSVDQYLYRFKALTTYDYSLGDFSNPPEHIQEPYTYHDQLTIPPTDVNNQRELLIKQNIQILGSSLNAELIAPWHSSYGIDIKKPDNGWPDAFELNASAVETNVQKNQADQPILSARFNKDKDTGAVWFTTVFHKEDEGYLASNAITMADLQTLANQDQDLFNTFGFNAITGIDPATYYQLGSNAFATKVNEWSTNMATRNVYQQIVYVMSQLLSQYNIAIPNPSDIETNGLSALTTAPSGQDPVYYLFESGSGGILDFIKAFTMTLRAMNIPARAVSAFSTGSYKTDGGPHFSVTLMDYHPYVEALIPVRLTNGTIVYHWGIFNLFPNLTTLQYEQNSLGVSGSIKIDLPSTNPIDYSGTPINSQQLGSNLVISLSATLSGSAYSNVPISVKLITASELQNLGTTNIQQVFDNSTGIFLAKITTDNQGKANFTLRTFLNNTILDLAGSPHTIQKIDPLNIEQTSYVVFAYIGFTTYNQSALIFTSNGTLTLTSDASHSTIPFGGDTYQGYTVVVNVDNTYTATLVDPDNQPIANETIDWFIMDQNDYQTYSSNPTLDLLQHPNFSTKTDNNGRSFKVMHFNQSQNGQFFAIIALWRGTSVNGSLVLQVTNDFTIDVTQTFNYTGTPSSPTDRTNVQTISAKEVMFRNTVAVPEQPVNGTRMYYYLVPSTSYSSFVRYTDLMNYLSSGTNGTDYFNISSQISDADATTGTDGVVSFSLSIVYGSLPAGQWKLVIVDHGHEVFADQGTISVTQPAGFNEAPQPPSLTNKDSSPSKIQVTPPSIPKEAFLFTITLSPQSETTPLFTRDVSHITSNTNNLHPNEITLRIMLVLWLLSIHALASLIPSLFQNPLKFSFSGIRRFE